MNKERKLWSQETFKFFIPPETLQNRVHELRSLGKTIATVNGSFDLLHAGHLQILFEAKELADILIVALNTDRSIQSYKGKDRPIVPLKYRIEMMSALKMVDFVTTFDEDDPRELLKKIRPDVHINGSEYGPNCIEKEVVEESGRLYICEKIPSLATSLLFAKIQQLPPLSVQEILDKGGI